MGLFDFSESVKAEGNYAPKESPCLKVWRYDQAPEEYKLRDVSNEQKSYIVFTPNELEHDLIGIFDIGWHDASSYQVESGMVDIMRYTGS